MKKSNATLIRICLFFYGLLSAIALFGSARSDAVAAIGFIGIIIFGIMSFAGLWIYLTKRMPTEREHEITISCRDDESGERVYFKAKGRIRVVHGFQFCIYERTINGLPHVVAAELWTGHAVKVLNTGPDAMRRLMEKLNAKSADEIGAAIISKMESAGLVEPLNEYIKF